MSDKSYLDLKSNGYSIQKIYENKWIGIENLILEYFENKNKNWSYEIEYNNKCDIKDHEFSINNCDCKINKIKQNQNQEMFINFNENLIENNQYLLGDENDNKKEFDFVIEWDKNVKNYILILVIF